MIKSLLKKLVSIFYNIPAKLIIKKMGKNARIYWPAIINHGEYIVLEDGAYIMQDARIQMLPLYEGVTPLLKIGQNSHINRFCHIVATHELIIGNNVGVGDSVMIADTTHEFQDITKSYLAQPLKFLGVTSIGDQCWIGRGSTIQGCKIGKHCVIGANAYVTKDIPDYCVVVGCPARIVKRYNPETHCWQKTDKDGNFITNDN